MSGLKRTLHQPAKKGLIKEADGSDWQRGDVYISNYPARDGDHLVYIRDGSLFEPGFLRTGARPSRRSAGTAT